MTASRDSVRILVVEDGANLDAGIEAQLAEFGHTVVATATGSERGLALAAEHEPDLVLVNLTIEAGLDGIEAARGFRESVSMPVVFLSGHRDAAMLERASKAEPAGLVVRPFDGANLHAAIEMARRKAGSDRRVRELSRELARQNERLDWIVQALSNDVRGHFRHISIRAEMLRDDLGEVAVSTTDDLVGISERAQRASRLLDGLLLLATVDSGRIAERRVDMLDLARRAAAAFEDAEVEFRFENVEACEGDASLLLQVWVNLLGNAAKFSRGVASPKVVIDSERQAERVAYRVRDNGPGFPAEEAEVVFEPFRRSESTPRTPGGGIGLAVVRRIVNAHGGVVRAESSEGQGATFVFDLPCPRSIRSV